MATPSRPEIYVLHDPEDQATCDALRERLSGHGVNAGSTFVGAGAKVLLKSRACVLLVGRSARQAGWARPELEQLRRRTQAKQPFTFLVVYLPGEWKFASQLSIPQPNDSFTLDRELDDELVARVAHALGAEPPERVKKTAVKAADDVTLPAAEAPADTVDTVTDHPADVDQLGRKVFAEVLVKRIRHMRAEESKRAQSARDPELRCGGPFLLHLYAPWGAGKTSVLNFMRAELEADDAWTVIDFNAWAHQRTAPPWWWLMTAVFRQGSVQLRHRDAKRWLRLWMWELGWRLRGGARGFLLILAGLAFAALVWSTGGFGLSSLESAAKAVTAVLVLLTTIYGSLAGVSRWLLVGSPRAAGTVLEHTRDPLQTLKKRFRRLVRFFDNRVAIFIDDLDRCQAPYVVSLLEGVQTLFNDVPVTYVVAADREWLCESYALEYEGFVTATSEPGRPLGYLFLEKTFQLSAPVPMLSSELQKDFFEGLLRVQGSIDHDALEQARHEAIRKYKELPDEQAIAGALEENKDAPPIQVQAEREAAVLRLAAPDVEARTGHTLQAFAPLLERNPRAIKRLINAYGVARATEIIGGATDRGDDSRHRLALWTILGLRWPLLADYLSTNPAGADAILAEAPPDESVPEGLRPLWSDERVRAVIDGAVEGVSVRLDSGGVRVCADRARAETRQSNGKPSAGAVDGRQKAARAAQ